MRLTPVRHIALIQVRYFTWVGVILVCQRIAMQTANQTLAFQVIMVKTKVGITSL